MSLKACLGQACPRSQTVARSLALRYFVVVTFPFLEKTSLWNALSGLGRRIETPKGIFYWSNRAKNEAEIDGTIGVAQDDDGTISHLKVAEQWAGAKAMERAPKGKIFGYTPIPGMESLRKKWLARMLEATPALIPYASLPVVTNGITHSLALATRLLLEPGQTIVTADASWENYEHIFTDMQGISIKTFPLFTSSNILNITEMVAACRRIARTQGKVVLLLNFPHNQTGFMPSPEECKALGTAIKALCEEFPKVPFAVLLDDAYEGYVYDEVGQKSSPLPQLFFSAPNYSLLKLDGISKVMLAYGYRVGFLTAFTNPLPDTVLDEAFIKGLRDEVTTKIGGLVRGEISQVNHHGQVLADALMDDLATVGVERAVVIARLAERWSAMMAALEEGYKKYGKTKLWANPCNSGFFCHVMLNPTLDPKKIAERLLAEKKVGVVPSSLGLRIAFAGVSKEKIMRLIEAVFEVVYG